MNARAMIRFCFSIGYFIGGCGQAAAPWCDSIIKYSECELRSITL